MYCIPYPAPGILLLTLNQAIKICAESQLEGAAEKCSVLAAIDELSRQKTVPDYDTLELYEWAAWDFIGGEIEYADTLGPLRVRWAKANPKNPAAIQCLRSCLEYWDLVSAQQVGFVCRELDASEKLMMVDFHGVGSGLCQLG